MKKDFVTVLFDRRKRVESTGEGKVDICIYLGKGERKYITIKTCTLMAWKKYQKSAELKMAVLEYKQVVDIMIKKNEEMTVATLDKYLGVIPRKKEALDKHKKKTSPTGFIDFIEERKILKNHIFCYYCPLNFDVFAHVCA